jgi:hypothetical protein
MHEKNFLSCSTTVAIAFEPGVIRWILKVKKLKNAAVSKTVFVFYRMLSARMKAEQAEEVAKKAQMDAEVARTKARQYSPGSSQPGKFHVYNANYLTCLRIT